MTVNIMKDTIGCEPVETEGFIEIGGHRCFTHSLKKWVWNDEENDEVQETEWRVSEYTSGYSFGYGKTKKEAIDDAKGKIEKHGVGRFEELIQKAVKETGTANDDESGKSSV